MGELFAFIFDGIADRFQQELRTVALQYPFEPLKYLRPPLRITFNEGIDLLRVRRILVPFCEDYIFLPSALSPLPSPPPSPPLPLHPSLCVTAYPLSRAPAPVGRRHRGSV